MPKRPRLVVGSLLATVPRQVHGPWPVEFPVRLVFVASICRQLLPVGRGGETQASQTFCNSVCYAPPKGGAAVRLCSDLLLAAQQQATWFVVLLLSLVEKPDAAPTGVGTVRMQHTGCKTEVLPGLLFQVLFELLAPTVPPLLPLTKSSPSLSCSLSVQSSARSNRPRSVNKPTASQTASQRKPPTLTSNPNCDARRPAGSCLCQLEAASA
ncbi:hypothetical protein CDD81_6871 [Ophiocordyceps australis]|uniref:Uncharacterized protein n=1 Tax=Ophiocordyceps australis TaxID=1399860 RepID=A0A2C5Y1S5_9HYPO|nr:hypothetical protein CDD81_6871 [Ophiocordyceps australis]